jgi:HamA
MMLFDDWCINDEEKSGKKRYWKLTERAGGRCAINEHLASTIRSHYDSLDRIAADAEKLGYKGAASILRERLPRSKKARSGDMGEILASELTEQRLGFRVPVRRTRYKDGREVALRGDDFIGVRYEAGKLWLLKGESKSRIVLSKTTITSARATLNRDNGRCTPASLLFVADRLLDLGGELEELGRAIRTEVAQNALPASRIDHVLFTLSGNAPSTALTEDYNALGQSRNQTVVNIRVDDHPAFIADIYMKVGSLGDD